METKEGENMYTVEETNVENLLVTAINELMFDIYRTKQVVHQITNIVPEKYKPNLELLEIEMAYIHQGLGITSLLITKDLTEAKNTLAEIVFKYIKLYQNFSIQIEMFPKKYQKYTESIYKKMNNTKKEIGVIWETIKKQIK